MAGSSWGTELLAPYIHEIRRWEERGVWRRLWKNLQAEHFAQARDLLMDSTKMRGHQHAAGAPKKTAPIRLLDALVGTEHQDPRCHIDENCSVALHLSAGHAHDGRQFETLYESLDPDNALESAILDKGYDADRIRQRLSMTESRPVIPPISTRSKKLHYNKELYRHRNLIERFFNKIKHFRRIAARYDKLRKTFFAALYLVAAFITIKNS